MIFTAVRKVPIKFTSSTLLEMPALPIEEAHGSTEIDERYDGRLCAAQIRRKQ